MTDIKTPPPSTHLENRVAELEAEIARFRSERGYVVGCNDGFAVAVDQAVAICNEKAEEWQGLCGTEGCVDCAKQFAAEIRALDATTEGSDNA